MKPTTREQITKVILEMNQIYDDYKKSFGPYSENKSLALLGTKAEDLSVLIQYHLKFGDE
jgi:hypothetical protein